MGKIYLKKVKVEYSWGCDGCFFKEKTDKSGRKICMVLQMKEKLPGCLYYSRNYTGEFIFIKINK